MESTGGNTIPFNKPFIIGDELNYIRQAVESGKISGDGRFTRLCQQFLESAFGFRKTLLTTSCTDALEMCALLLNIQPGDEVIMPSFNFVSAANAFALRGAKIVFGDIDPHTFNLDAGEISRLLSPKTKAVVIVHYGGISCPMEEISSSTRNHNIAVIEDTALAFDSWYTDSLNQKRILGSLGDFATFSFHETKNIICGEGGALIINRKEYIEKAEIIREKGTDRSKLFRGETNKYTWQSLGSSFLPSDITAAFLYAQLEKYQTIIQKRKTLYHHYDNLLADLDLENKITRQRVPPYATINGQQFAFLCKNEDQRTRLINYLHQHSIKAVFHYQPLHKSPWYTSHYPEIRLPVTEHVSERIIRLPLFYELSLNELEHICDVIGQFYKDETELI